MTSHDRFANLLFPAQKRCHTGGVLYLIGSIPVPQKRVRGRIQIDTGQRGRATQSTPSSSKGRIRRHLAGEVLLDAGCHEPDFAVQERARKHGREDDGGARVEEQSREALRAAVAHAEADGDGGALEDEGAPAGVVGEEAVDFVGVDVARHLVHVELLDAPEVVVEVPLDCPYDSVVVELDGC